LRERDGARRERGSEVRCRPGERVGARVWDFLFILVILFTAGLFLEPVVKSIITASSIINQW